MQYSLFLEDRLTSLSPSCLQDWLYFAHSITHDSGKYLFYVSTICTGEVYDIDFKIVPVNEIERLRLFSKNEVE